MKRTLLVVLFLALAGVIALAWMSGRQAIPAGPDPNEILRQAAAKVRSLQSARFAVHGQFETAGGAMPVAGTFSFQGTLQDAGTALQFDAAVDTLVTPNGDRNQLFRVRGEGGVVLIRQEELFLKITSLQTEPDGALFQPELIALLSGRWWVLPGETHGPQAAVPGGTMTPSPTILLAQSQVVRVDRDLGVASVDGSPAYHYRVTLDAEKLLAYLEQVARERQEAFDRKSVAAALDRLSATGEMWIDRASLYLRKVEWTIDGLRWGVAGVQGSFSATLSDFNAAQPVVPPADAQPLSPAALFGVGTPEELKQLKSLLPEGTALPASP